MSVYWKKYSIEKNLLAKDLKTLPKEDIIATIKYTIKDIEKEETDTICAKISLTPQNSKPLKYSLMDHINNGPYQLLKKEPTTQTKTLKQLKALHIILFHMVALHCAILTNT